MKTLLLFIATALAEIVGCYLPWLVLRQGRSVWWLVPAAAALAVFAWLLTLHPTAAGRTYAAYGGMYIAVALLWLRLVDGVVLTRSVEPGQAVAASLQAVTLMTIAADLRQMRLQVNVDEADVGRVQAQQGASFTVSAYPSRSYQAKVTRVAYGSTTTDNVVTYTTYLDVSNEDLSLRPGMTASASIAALERRQVLLVPNTALRFSPAASGAPAGAGQGGGILSQLMPRPPGGPSGASRGGNAGKGNVAAGQRQIWVLEPGQPGQPAQPRALQVQVLNSDGRYSEVQGQGLREGLSVITDQQSAKGRS